jgi:hypothetical protein
MVGVTVMGEAVASASLHLDALKQFFSGSAGVSLGLWDRSVHLRFRLEESF